MATWIWEFSSAGSKLQFTITYETGTGLTIESFGRNFEIDALLWDDGRNISTHKIKGADNGRNMNNLAAVDWDGIAKLSRSGFGNSGELGSGFISAGKAATFALSDFEIAGVFDLKAGGTLGVQGTSAGGRKNFKLIDKYPTAPGGTPAARDFLREQDISQFVFYYEETDDGIKPVGLCRLPVTTATMH